ncbi:hypothetical protein [Chromohalobacter nigrandesensis]|uniref:hypothetical protein n=1 Tax=Chromohalobacter nigrandesensis TaxID=119863 RepID=UPI001FF3470D|nr:hypothetical protein [Chromohalobacter nigrandesensis]MCK0746283.1 hypothetical protein [Chromohalobacter nigrandesensis]
MKFPFGNPGFSITDSDMGALLDDVILRLISLIKNIFFEAWRQEKSGIALY